MIEIRTMTIDDYDMVYELWGSITNFAIRSIDDSKEGISFFLKRNPDTSVVALDNGKVVGSILCGHDGRRASFYHVCVSEKHRNQGIGKRMAGFAIEALKKENINKVSLIAFKKNELGNQFWKSAGWTFREDINYYDYTLNENNVIEYTKNE